MFNFKKKKEISETEKLYQDNEHIFFPPSSFDGYEIIDDSKENLINICKLISNNLVDITKVNFENNYKFVDSLIELGYITPDFKQEYSLEQMINEINKLARNLNYNIELTEKNVLDKDNNNIKEIRKIFDYLTNHDLTTSYTNHH